MREDAQDARGLRAIVTGGSAGLGLAIVRRLLAAGAEVTIVDLVPPSAEVDANYVELDLSGEAARNAMSDLSERLSGLDLLVANAGVVPPWRRLRDVDGEEWLRVMAINTWGVAASIGGCADALAASDRGAVVAMASINGYKAHASQVLYTASKHAVVGIVRAAALDLGPSGVRVNGIAPGPIATNALVGRVAARHGTGGPAPEVALKALANETALGRIATEDEVAKVAVFLGTDASSGMTGTILPVEAGIA